MWAGAASSTDRHCPELPRSVSQGDSAHSTPSAAPDLSLPPVLLKQSGEGTVVNLQLLLVIVVERRIYVGWGRFALGSLGKISWNAKRKKVLLWHCWFLNKCITVLCLAVFVYSKLLLFKELGFWHQPHYQLEPVLLLFPSTHEMSIQTVTQNDRQDSLRPCS